MSQGLVHTMFALAVYPGRWVSSSCTGGSTMRCSSQVEQLTLNSTAGFPFCVCVRCSGHTCHDFVSK